MCRVETTIITTTIIMKMMMMMNTIVKGIVIGVGVVLVYIKEVVS